MSGHKHDLFQCPPHVGGCTCAEPGNSVCNPYYVAGYCPDDGDSLSY